MEIPENVLFHVGFKKIQSINQNAELTAGIHTLVFSWIFKMNTWPADARSNPVSLPDLYFDPFSYPVASIVFGDMAIVSLFLPLFF